MKSSLVAGTEGAVTQGLTEIDTSAWGDLPREQVEVMTRTTGATQLWWETVIDGVASGWSELQGNGQLVGLVKSLAAAGDKLVIEDDSPVTRYAQIMLIDEGILHVELASLQPEGTYNWRIGMGRDADDAVNTPGHRNGRCTRAHHRGHDRSLVQLGRWPRSARWLRGCATHLRWLTPNSRYKKSWDFRGDERMMIPPTSVMKMNKDLRCRRVGD